jgi:limonene-1,2-epoxide hydrolase
MKTILSVCALFAATPVLAAPVQGAAAPAAPAANRSADDVLSRMFIWWNQAFKDPEGFTPEAFGRYFTDDAVMRINGTNRAKGLKDLAARFRMIQSKVDAVEIQVPFVTVFPSADGSKLFTYHLETSIEKGKPGRSMVMGYVELRGGKIALVNFLSVEGEPGPVAMP